MYASGFKHPVSVFAGQAVVHRAMHRLWIRLWITVSNGCSGVLPIGHTYGIVTHYLTIP